MSFIVFIHNKKDCSKSIVRGISFHNELSIGDLVYKNRYTFFKELKVSQQKKLNF